MALLAIEFLLLFFVGPTLFACTRHRVPAIPALWGVAAYCLLVMLHDPRFDRGVLWGVLSNDAGLRQNAPAILRLFAVALVIGIALVLRYTPENFLNLPRSKPRMWGSLMILYPILSVYPQGFVYRTFVFARYRDLFGSDWAIVLASAIAFGYVHIVFRSSLTVALSFLGGLLFAMRYLQTGSLVVSSFEHALYGCTIFTIGLGRWFLYRSLPSRAMSAASS